MKAVLCSVLLGVTGAAVSGDEAREKPLDYMQGVMLETTGASPWYRVELSPLLYQGTAWPDLRDVRVFNHQGETVPFALQVQKAQPVTPEAMTLRLFPLEMSPVPPREEGDAAENHWSCVQQRGSKFIWKPMMRRRSGRATY